MEPVVRAIVQLPGPGIADARELYLIVPEDPTIELVMAAGQSELIDVVALSAIGRVVPEPTIEHVVPAAADEKVVAVAAREAVGVGRIR